ncbi:gamma-glutamyl-gamma-aminobutyrate hydrolase family protein [Aquipseudomonas campi]
MKLVAVSQRVDTIAEYGESRDALDQRLTAFLLAGGYLPVPVPNTLQSAVEEGGDPVTALSAWLATFHPAGIVLSGGNDIGECPERDATELLLLEHAEAQRLPVLGICRGMQMLAHWAGMTLEPVSGHVASRQWISGAIEGETNSFHRLALSACPKDFDVLATSVDGVIKAIRHASLPWEGWMWHPERESRLNPRDILRLKALLQ